jgi:Zn-dependent protease
LRPGSAAGTLGALACFYLARYFDSQLLPALAYAGCFINLFNLIPLRPFDGGRITAVISPKMRLVGAQILVGMFFYHPSPLLILIAALALAQIRSSVRGGNNATGDYYIASHETRFAYGALYVGLAGFLAIMSHQLSLELPRG